MFRQLPSLIEAAEFRPSLVDATLDAPTLLLASSLRHHSPPKKQRLQISAGMKSSANA
jgi:hypothetical protein